jgi:hypothetical protein
MRRTATASRRLMLRPHRCASLRSPTLADRDVSIPRVDERTAGFAGMSELVPSNTVRARRRRAGWCGLTLTREASVESRWRHRSTRFLSLDSEFVDLRWRFG